MSAASRRLGSALEPIVGQVYFSQECHANYAGLGFNPSARKADGVALPDGPAYFTSRGSVMGQVPGEVVAAARGLVDELLAILIPWGETIRAGSGYLRAGPHDLARAAHGR